MLRRKGFTLVELLVVVGIIAALGSAVVLIINPAELLRNGRDSVRISDFNNIQNALSLVAFDQPSISFGSANTVYVSLPDVSPTCANLNLPGLPVGWIYSCQSENSYRNVDGTGWIPVNFASLSIKSPFSTLPIDPVSDASRSLFYTYVTNNGDWKVTSSMESAKHGEETAKDKGVDLTTYEIGTDMSLASLGRGLVGYWQFDEGSGTSAYDSSGFGHTLSLSCSSSCNLSVSERWTGGKTGTGLRDDGFAYPQCQRQISGSYQGPVQTSFTALGWIYPMSQNGNPGILIGRWWGGTSGSIWSVEFNYQSANSGNLRMHLSYDNLSDTTISSGTIIGTNAWHFFAVTHEDGKEARIYIDGNLDTTSAYTNGIYNSALQFSVGSNTNNNNCAFNGIEDEIAVYNRVLTANQIKGIYNAEK